METKPFRIGEFVTPETVVMQLQANHRDGVLRELVDVIPGLKGRDKERDKLLQALKEREQLCSTGMGDGVAMPHARNALVGLVSDPVIVFGRKVNGIAFDAVDGQPAKLFFLIVAPNVTVHLRVLARLSRLLRNPRLRQDLLLAEHSSRVLSLLRVNEVDLGD